MYPRSIQKLIEAFSRFPTVGPRAASRFVFYVMRAPQKEVDELVQAILAVKQEIQLCSFCFNPFDSRELARGEPSEGLCEICSDTTRDQTMLCVVEKESDLEALEKTKQYKGRYFILGSTHDILKKEGVQNMRVAQLKERISGEQIQELIIALNPTAEGETAALFLERLAKPLNVKVTRIGRGLPTGGELEYADEETIRSALQGRR